MDTEEGSTILLLTGDSEPTAHSWLKEAVSVSGTSPVSCVWSMDASSGLCSRLPKVKATALTMNSTFIYRLRRGEERTEWCAWLWRTEDAYRVTSFPPAHVSPTALGTLIQGQIYLSE